MSKWSVACVIKFLEIYQKHECLWNPRNENYKYKTAKELALDSIVQELNMPGVTPYDIKLKIKSIRTAYKRELTAVLKSFKESDDRRYVPKLFWFKLADSFLRPVSMKKRSVKCLEQNQRKPVEINYKNDSCKTEPFIRSDSAITDQSQENTMCNENEFSTETETTKEQIILSSYKIHSNDDDEVVVTEIGTQSHDIHIEDVQCTEEICNASANINSTTTITTAALIDNHGVQTTHDMQSHVETSVNDDKSTLINNRPIEEDDYFIFGRSVAAQLRAIPDLYSRSAAKFKIQQILFEAETGQYKRRTTFEKS